VAKRTCGGVLTAIMDTDCSGLRQAAHRQQIFIELDLASEQLIANRGLARRREIQNLVLQMESINAVNLT
jgi:hypothetical protein